jgi:hypothetical protein
VITPVPTPTPVIPPIFNAQQVQTDLSNVSNALDNAHNSNWFLDPRDEVALRKAVTDVQKPLDKGNQKMTARAAQDLSHKLDDVIKGNRLVIFQELRQAVDNLVRDAGPA